MPRPGHFTSRKETQYPLYRSLGEPQGWSGWVWKILLPLGLDSQTVQSITSHYTNSAIPAHEQLVDIYRNVRFTHISISTIHDNTDGIQQMLIQELRWLCSKSTTVLLERIVPKPMNVSLLHFYCVINK